MWNECVALLPAMPIMRRTCVCTRTLGQDTGFGSSQRCKHHGCVNKSTNSFQGKKKDTESISAYYYTFSIQLFK